MAGHQEIALGIAGILQRSPMPEPLPVTFRGQTLEDGADLVLRIIAECQDAGIALSHVALDPALWGFLQAGDCPAAVLLVSDLQLSGVALFFRYSARTVGGEGSNVPLASSHSRRVPSQSTSKIR